MVPSYPWYVADWIGSRSRASMTLEERGLYRDVLDLCFQAGSVPGDERVLRRLVGADEDEWRRAWPAVRARLIVTETGDLTHHRVQELLPVLLSAAAARRKSSSIAATARWDAFRARIEGAAGVRDALPDASVTQCATGAGSNADLCGTSASSSALHTHTAPDGAGERGSDPKKANTSKAWQAEAFVQFWAGVWAKIGRGAAEKVFRRVAIDPATAERIITAAREQGPRLLAEARAQQRTVLHPATWLSQGRYDDEAPATPPGGGSRDPGDLPESVPAWLRGDA